MTAAVLAMVVFIGCVGCFALGAAYGISVERDRQRR